MYQSTRHLHLQIHPQKADNLRNLQEAIITHYQTNLAIKLVQLFTNDRDSYEIVAKLRHHLSILCPDPDFLKWIQSYVGYVDGIWSSPQNCMYYVFMIFYFTFLAVYL